MTAVQPLRVAMIGTGFVGAAHSQAWRVAPRFFDLPLVPEMSVIVGRDAAKTRAAAEKFGWAEASADWRDVVARDGIDLIDICSPGDSHAEIAIAALAAGKHVLCEKPLANTVEQARAMAEAACAAAEGSSLSRRSTTGFRCSRCSTRSSARRPTTESGPASND